MQAAQEITYLGINIASTKIDVNIRFVKPGQT